MSSSYRVFRLSLLSVLGAVSLLAASTAPAAVDTACARVGPAGCLAPAAEAMGAKPSSTR